MLFNCISINSSVLAPLLDKNAINTWGENYIKLHQPYKNSGLLHILIAFFNNKIWNYLLKTCDFLQIKHKPVRTETRISVASSWAGCAQDMRERIIQSSQVHAKQSDCGEWERYIYTQLFHHWLCLSLWTQGWSLTPVGGYFKLRNSGPNKRNLI